MLIVGSYALKSKGILSRTPQDVDFIGSQQDFRCLIQEQVSAGAKVQQLMFKEDGAYAKLFKNDERIILECMFTDGIGALCESNAEVYKWGVANCWLRHATPFGVHDIARPVLILMLKLSHRFKKDSPHFLKTLRDIEILRETSDGDWGSTLGEQLYWNNPELLEMLARREKATYQNSLPKLNTSKKNFFTDSVPYQYDHDTIHEAVKMLDKPAYQYYIKDGEQVLCDMEKFKALPEIVKLYGVLEESYVLALERAIIPHGTEPKKAFDIALEKVCTSITSGVFREFAWENYTNVQSLYHESFVNKFNTALASGLIAPYKK